MTTNLIGPRTRQLAACAFQLRLLRTELGVANLYAAALEAFRERDRVYKRNLELELEIQRLRLQLRDDGK